jgi:hypothetical protein
LKTSFRELTIIVESYFKSWCYVKNQSILTGGAVGILEVEFGSWWGELIAVFVVASSPPTTPPKSTTTETPSRIRDILGNGNLSNSIYGNPSSLTIHQGEKGIFVASKRWKLYSGINCCC